MRTLAVVTLAALAGAAVLLALVWFGQRALIYLPGDAAPSSGRAPAAATEVMVRTEDGLELGAWHLAATPGGATVLVTPGNAGDRSVRAPLAEALHERGVGTLLLDYRGYAGNPGRPSEDGLALDARAARSYLVEEAGIAPADLLYYGESIGAAVAAELAVAHPPAGLVLRSPFTSLADVAAVHYPFPPAGLLLRDRFEVVDHVAAVAVPTAVVLGTEDGIVPPQQSREVAAAAAGPVALVEVEGAGHNDRALLDGAALVEAVLILAASR